MPFKNGPQGLREAAAELAVIMERDESAAKKTRSPSKKRGKK